MLIFLLSAFTIAISEMGDKTQLIAIVLASRFQKPLPILLGILAATLLSNILAALLGQSLGSWLHDGILHGILALSFFATALWALIPDKIEEMPPPPTKHGVFLASFCSFLIAEMGDKTQIAALTMTAHFHSAVLVMLGTTTGMMAANIPAVIFGHKIIAHIPLKVVRLASGLLFAVLGIYEVSRLLKS